MVVTENRRGCLVYERGQAALALARLPPGPRDRPDRRPATSSPSSFATQYHRTGNPRAAADFANCAASFALEKRAWQGIPTAEAVADRLKRGKRRGA